MLQVTRTVQIPSSKNQLAKREPLMTSTWLELNI
jgi:hypothetical protein